MNESHYLPVSTAIKLLRPTWVEVDLDAIEHNVKSIKKMLGAVKLIGVLKGDGCGFGIEECGIAMESAGADMLAVANPFEVQILRNHGVHIPILIFASYPPQLAHEIVKLDAIPTLVDFESARAFAEASKSRLSKPLDIFVKVDTGLGRLGIPLYQTIDLIKWVSTNPQLNLKGIYSHTGGSTEEKAEQQFREFQKILSEISQLGIRIPIQMIASTPIVLKNRHMWLSAVDPGRLLFGITHPPGLSVSHINLRQTLRALRTRIIQVKQTYEDEQIKYGNRPIGKTKKYGILPFGWVDVFLPSLYLKSGGLVRGVKVPFCPKPFSTEHSVLDLTAVPNAKAGDTVTLIGKDGNASIEIDSLAKQGDRLISEITRRFHRHLSFIYFKKGRPVKLKTLANGESIGVQTGSFINT